MSHESQLSTIQRYTQVYSDTYAALPAANVRRGSLGYATDRRTLYRWTGAAWSDISIYSDSGAIADIPAATVPEGSLYFATDTLELWQLQSAAWVRIVPAVIYSASGVIGDIPAAATVAAGSFYYATDEALLYQKQGAAWVSIESVISGWNLIGSASPSGVTNITVNFTAHDLVKAIFKLANSAVAILQLQLNGDTGAHYEFRMFDGNAIISANAQGHVRVLETDAVITTMLGEILIEGKHQSGKKHLSFSGSAEPYNLEILINGTHHTDANDLTSINLRASAGNLNGEIQVYGKNF